jgi:helicase
LTIDKDELIKELIEKKGIPSLWPVQQMAVDQGLLDKEENFIITAPTASGKTFAAELACYKCLKEKGRVIYLVPTNSLINDKSNDFKYLSDEYKISGSSIKRSDWNDSDIVITAFESFYKQALLNTEVIEGFDLAIIDEFHILYSRLRGFTLEKIMTLLKIIGTRIICLSATFKDKEEIASWLKARIIDNTK